MTAIAAARKLALFSGPAGTGKTQALVEEAAMAIETYGPGAVVVASSNAAAARRLRTLVGARLAGEARDAAMCESSIGTTLDRIALAVVHDAGLASGIALDATLVDDAAAERRFADCAAPLYALEWTELVSDEIDPEISGLRTPERFARTALGLIRKLRDAAISPDAFLETALRGAAAFYGRPPNFADPRLLTATRDDYRDSLMVDARELERQRRREVDLAKVLARLYRAYIDEVVARGSLTPVDALVEAARTLGAHPPLAARWRERYAAAYIDDAQDLPSSAVGFMKALFGDDLQGVTFAGDADQATRTFAGARPDRIFALPGLVRRFDACERFGDAIANAIAFVLERPLAGARGDRDDVRLFRAKTADGEPRWVADRIAELVAGGTSPGGIAVVSRSLRCAMPVGDALLEHDIDIAHAGEYDFFADHDVRDALAFLHVAVDPYAHAHVLRVLQTAAFGFDDETLALLCGEPPDPQALLFELPPEEMQGAKRWDRRRDLRLGTNVVRGDRDTELPEAARERLAALRVARERWDALLGTEPLADAVATILKESGLSEARFGENDARRRRRIALLDELQRRAREFSAFDPRRSLETFLLQIDRDVETFAASDTRCEGVAAVTIADVEAIKGEEFDHVFIVDVRAGGFSPYYAPDAFLFSQRWGMIPKEAAGDARAARTAKFTWYHHDAKLRDTYAREARRALASAIGRARKSVTVTAFGKPTRGIAAPELLAELQSAPIAASDLSANLNGR